MTTLAGKTALVTGGSRGIGRAIAVRLGRDGARVAVHYGYNEPAAKETVAAIEAAGGQAFTVHNTRTPFFVAQHGLRRLRDGGRIINIGPPTTAAG